MMTFENLHRDLDCDCLADSSIRENTSDTFLRRVHNAPPLADDFASYYEEGRPKHGDDCEYLCKYRGVSVNKVDASIENTLKSKWAEVARFKPRMPRIVCKFKFREGAGKVWHTPSIEPSHHTLLKADQFGIELLELIDSTPL